MLSLMEKYLQRGSFTEIALNEMEDSRPQHKIYGIDNSLMNAEGFQFMNREGMLLENAVYNELIKSGYENISFASAKEECDFVAHKDGVYHAFQVCHTLTPLNQDREFAGFIVLNKNLKVESKNLITYDTSDTVGDIYVMPFWDFFGI